MISVPEAEKLISQNLDICPTESTPFASALGRTLREPLTADRELPPFNRATLDGIAIASSQLESGRQSFSVAGIATAGAAQQTLSDPTTCLEIMTGAPLPTGADIVVRIEDLQIENGTATLAPNLSLKSGLGVHPQGSDCQKGQTLLQPGCLLTAKELAIAASIGKTELLVSTSPSIAVISTGDELVSIATTPEPHQIRRSNDSTLAAALISSGFTHTQTHHLPDLRETVETEIEKLLNTADVLVIAGGISKGKFDYLPNALKKNGVEEIFQWVSQRPGKPFWFGIYKRNGRRIPIFALPGNPVSCFTCLHRYTLPALRKMSGLADPKPNIAKLKEAISFKAPLSFFLPVSIEVDENGTQWASPLPFNTSGDFISVAQTNGFIQLPKDQINFEAGTKHPFFPWA